MVKAKICGIKTLQDALFAAECGVWALGFNFYKSSPRFIDPSEASKIAAQLPLRIVKVGLFVDATSSDIMHAFDFLDAVQVYEDHPDIPDEYKKRSIFAFQAGSKDDIPSSAILANYGYILIDAAKASDGLHGGTGRLANLALAGELAGMYKLILAGGLNADNVSQAISAVHPFAVDTASGVEDAPGRKNSELVRRFLMNVKSGKD